MSFTYQELLNKICALLIKTNNQRKHNIKRYRWFLVHSSELFTLLFSSPENRVSLIFKSLYGFFLL